MVNKTPKIASDDTNDYTVLLRVLSNLLVEMRATDNLNKVKILSDVFHNVPAGISSKFTSDAIEQEVYMRAARLNCEKQVAAMFSSARQGGEAFKKE